MLLLNLTFLPPLMIDDAPLPLPPKKYIMAKSAAMPNTTKMGVSIIFCVCNINNNIYRTKIIQPINIKMSQYFILG